MTKLVYLATPIDFSDLATERLESIKAKVLERGHGVFCPAQAWKVPYKAVPNSRLQHANVEVLHACNGLLALLETKTLTIGVIVEIIAAKSAGIPIAVVGELAHSWALPYLEVEAFEDLDQALDYLSYGMDKFLEELIEEDD